LFYSNKKDWRVFVLQKPRLSIAMTSLYKKDGMEEALEDIVNIFDIEDRVYMLKSKKDETPSIVFSFGELNNKNFGDVYFNIETDHWKSASKKIANVVSKQKKKSDSILIFEYGYEGAKAKLTCRTRDSKTVKSAMESIKNAIQSFAKLVEDKNIPSSKSMIYCGFDKKAKEYKIDRAIVLTPKFQEYIFNEKKSSWEKVNQKSKKS